MSGEYDGRGRGVRRFIFGQKYANKRRSVNETRYRRVKATNCFLRAVFSGRFTQTPLNV